MTASETSDTPGAQSDEDQVVVVTQRPEQAPQPRERVVEIVQLQHQAAATRSRPGSRRAP